MKKLMIATLSLIFALALLMGLAGCGKTDAELWAEHKRWHFWEGYAKRPAHEQEQEYAHPLLEAGETVECLDEVAYNIFISKNPSLPAYFLAKERLAVLGEFKSLLVDISPADTADYENVTVEGYTYKLLDTASGATFCFGITSYGEALLPTGALPATDFLKVDPGGLAAQDDVRLILNGSGAPCVIDLEGVRYTYDEDGRLCKIEWAYRGILVCISDFDGVPTEVSATSYIGSLLRTTALASETVEEINSILLATLIPAA